MRIVFSLTLFVSAMLMFLVQPMVGKMILPHLGGTSAVWTTCMVFFQGMLLLGYGYTHLLATTQSLRRQMALQAAVLALPFCVLPFALGDWELADPAANPVLPLLGTLAVMVGLPFFAVSTTAPLLQKWFVHTGDASAHDPYFLYAASNLGSIVGLLLYPFVVEPLWPVSAIDAGMLSSQAQIWTLGFAVFVGMVAVIGGIVTLKAGAPALPGVMPVLKASRAPASADLTVGRRLRWLALAAIPSSLMLGVTTHMTTDIAAVPFLWVLPLALYLLTFIVVFARWPFVWLNGPHRIMLYVQPCLVAMMLFLMIGRPTTPLWVNFVVHLAAFASTALVCHGALAEDRPGAGQLTEFYFWLALGGVAGGAFNAILAPIVFQFGVWEYPLAIVAACLMRSQPHTSAPRPTTRLGYALLFAVPLTLGAISFHLAYAAGDPANVAARWQRPLVLALPCVLLTTMIWRPICFAATLAALFISVGFADRINEPLVYEGRSFFGVLRVRVYAGIVNLPKAPGVDYPRSERTSIRMLVHGGVNHGGQIVAYIDEFGNETPGVTQRKRRAPIMYFHERNGVAEVFHRLAWGQVPPPGANLAFHQADCRLAVSLVGLAATSAPTWALLADTQSEPPFAVLGLGSGILAAYAKPYQRADFFEIDPLVKSLSVVPGYVPPWRRDRAPLSSPLPDPVFSFVQDAQERGANVSILLGDGRFKLREAPPAYYHLLCLDVFSSDAIPVHLLTAEAIELYMSKLADGGVLLCNTSNRHVDVPHILAAIAHAKGYECLVCTDDPSPEDHPERVAAQWVVLQRQSAGPGFHNGFPPVGICLERERPRLAWNGQPVLDGRGANIMETRWRPIEPGNGPIWTDRYSSLFRYWR